MTGYGHHGFRISGIADFATEAMPGELRHGKFQYHIVVYISKELPGLINVIEFLITALSRLISDITLSARLHTLA